MAPVVRFPKPRSCMHIIPLRTAAEFIALSLLINKVTGFYGILAIFTGYHLNPLQLSHYIYSLTILFIVGWLSTSIRPPPGGPNVRIVLKNLALAWIYIIDTVINGVYTTLFGMGWFVLLAQQHGIVDSSASAPGKSTMDETAGFTTPEVNASAVDIIATPKPGFIPGHGAIAIPSTDDVGSTVGGVVLRSDSITSIVVLGVLWLVRVYFCLIMLSYARSLLRQYIALASVSTSSAQPYDTSDDPSMAASPFEGVSSEVSGWKAQIGRAMLRLPTKRYWLGREEQIGQSEWERATSTKFESGRKSESGRRSLHIRVPSDRGNVERERRARSGTGPSTRPSLSE